MSSNLMMGRDRRNTCPFASHKGREGWAAAFESFPPNDLSQATLILDDIAR